MHDFTGFFNNNKLIVAMIHIQATPCSPKNNLTPKEIVSQAVEEARVYYEEGVKCVMIENMHDVPYLKGGVGPEVTSLLSIVGNEIKNKFDLFCGVQILAAANKEALATAYCAGLDFVRVEGYVFGHIGDEGYIDSDAGELLRYRKSLGANEVMIFTDIKKKHSSHSITNDLSIIEHAKAAEFFLSDGLIVTGQNTGEPPKVDDLMAVKSNSNLPLLIGSGINAENIQKYFKLADGFIIGSDLKHKGDWKNPPDKGRVKGFLDKLNRINSLVG